MTGHSTTTNSLGHADHFTNLDVHARLLGGIELHIGGKPLAPLESGRVESVFAYLMLHRNAPQSRQRFAFLLWPDSTERQAQTNLRKVLHNLRRLVPEADRLIDIGSRTIAWRADASLRLDVEQFELALAEGHLLEAVETYRGELLEGNDDEWLLEHRRRLADLYLQALERLTRRHQERRQWSQAIRYAERLMAQDSLREESHRLLMQLHQAAGDRTGAVRAYHVCAAALASELGIDPSSETQAIYESLITSPQSAGSSREGTADPTTAAWDRDASGLAPFVGRGMERDQLAAMWRQSTSGCAQLVLVSGEAGVGKTRLVDELRTQTSALAVEARAYPAEGTLPYGVAAMWLRSQLVAGRLPRLNPQQLSDLGRLVPEFAGRAAPPEPVPEAELRERLFGAITRALLSAGTPLLLIMDDAQWADAQSVRLMHYLLRAAPSARLLVAATARREELDADHPLVDVITALQTVERFTEIPLGRLDRQETALLAEGLTGAPLDPGTFERLYGDSEGNPLFVTEALRSDAPSVAPRVQAVIAGRLSHLSRPAAKLAGLAAAVGRDFTADVLASTAGLEEPVFVAALDELWRRGIVRAHSTNGYDFSHGKIRAAAYDALSPPRKREAHLAIAHALERGEGAAPAVLALHYERAGSIPEAIRWYERAAEAAQWLHAHSDAIAALERALALSEHLAPGLDVAVLQLRMVTALPAPLLAREGYGSERMRQTHARALLLAAELGVEPEPPMVWSLALAALARGEWEVGRKFGEQLRVRAERDDDQLLWVESAYIRGIAAFWRGALVDARIHFEAAMERFQPIRRRAHVLRYGQDPELLVRLRLAHTLWILGESRESDRQRDIALRATGESTHPYSRTAVAVWAALLALDRGDVDDLRIHARSLSDDSGGAAAGQILLANECFSGHLDVLDGRVEEGLARVHAVRRQVMAGAYAPGQPGVVTRILLAGYAIADEPNAALTLADEALHMGRGAELWEAEFRRLRAGFLADLGAPFRDVDDELRRAVAAARRQGARSFEERARGTLTERSRIDDRGP
ncbi:MAG: ATP-binding protein [Candidatus Dormibacteria bacterium]